MPELFDSVQRIWEEGHIKIPTHTLNTLLARAVIERPPRFPKNKICKVRYITQIDTNPPTFMAFTNDKKKANFSFKKWLTNTIRLEYGFIGTPLRVFRRDKNDKKNEKDQKHGHNHDGTKKKWKEEWDQKFEELTSRAPAPQKRSE